jgi:predicted phage terminase large subunit-like protein
LYSSEEPDRLRGPQQHRAWCDEVGAWRAVMAADGYGAWEMLQMGLRLGDGPQTVVTTTPKPTALIRRLASDPSVHITRGTTYENLKNLAPAYRDIVSQFEGTRLGRQELHAEILDDIEGALWSRAMVDAARAASHPDLTRVVVAIDPAASSGASSDETGIIVAGLGVDGHGYVLADLTCRLSPDGWARRAVGAYYAHKADRIVAEVNNGGEMVAHTIRTVDHDVPYRAVHASRGKIIRAEPVAALYEQGKIHHVGALDALEDQMTSFTPDNIAGISPDRVDALVWALTDLMVTGKRVAQVAPPLMPHTSGWRVG